MKKYYINNTQQPSGDYEVHAEGCYWLALANNTSYLGLFYNCGDAVSAAKRLYPLRNRINGCATCSKDCHTT
jgi:hypothetical protein